MSEQPKGELVCNANDIQVKQALRILIDDYPVAVVKDSMGEIHAIGDTCSHADISLSEGEVEGCAIECWGHGSQFDLRNGQPLQLPAYDPEPLGPMIAWVSPVLMVRLTPFRISLVPCSVSMLTCRSLISRVDMLFFLFRS